jgi:hypothetical protein
MQMDILIGVADHADRSERIVRHVFSEIGALRVRHQKRADQVIQRRMRTLCIAAREDGRSIFDDRQTFLQQIVDVQEVRHFIRRFA